jgi:DMSO/TMAO reductase YedYZ molybdopterin-dependent catalytic subunit
VKDLTLKRRNLLGRALALGALTALPGCDYDDPAHPDLADRFLHAMSSWNDRMQAALDPTTYRLELGGQIQETAPWSLAQLRAMNQEAQITRLICVEGWRVIGQWSGVPLGHFLKRIGADTTCKYVSFKCADGYYSSIDMASALHPQTILALDFLNAPLTPAFGAPVRLRIPTKLGFKNPKSLMRMNVGNVYTGGYWEDQGYNWFSGS